MSLADELLSQRLQRTKEIEALGFRPYGRRFDFTHTVPQIQDGFGEKSAEVLAQRVHVRVCGRLGVIRRMGKAGFAHLSQKGVRLQIYVRSNDVSPREWKLYELLDIGDVIGVEGFLFRTRTG